MDIWLWSKLVFPISKLMTISKLSTTVSTLSKVKHCQYCQSCQTCQNWQEAVCEKTQNLNETEFETFFWYQIFPIPNPIPNLSDTESDYFSDTKFLRYRIQYFFFDTESETIKKVDRFQNREVSKLMEIDGWGTNVPGNQFSRESACKKIFWPLHEPVGWGGGVNLWLDILVIFPQIGIFWPVFWPFRYLDFTT